MNGARLTNSVVSHPQVTQKKIKAERSTAVPGSLEYIDEFVTYQHRRRRVPKDMASGGAAVGAAVGGFVGLEVALCSGGLAAPIGIPVAVAGGTLVGGLLGFLPEKFGPGSGSPDPDAFGLHTFHHMGVVASRRDSKKIVSSLKKHGVLARGRRRTMVDVKCLAPALTDLKLRQGDLSPQQCEAIACLVHTQDSEVARRAALFVKVRAVQDDIEKKRELVVASGTDPDSNQDLQELWKIKRGLMTEIARLPSERTAPAVRGKPAQKAF